MAVNSPVEMLPVFLVGSAGNVPSRNADAGHPGSWKSVWGTVCLHSAALVSDDVTASSSSTVDWLKIDFLNID